MEKVEDVVGKAVSDVGAQRKRLDSAYQRRAIVRYDAIKDVGGKQSTTIALLDATAPASWCRRSRAVTMRACT
jgi:hypothetical protein